MKYAAAICLLFGLLLPSGAQAADSQSGIPKHDYLYYRDANVPPFQKSREFFDMPDRPGKYGITLVSYDMGPLTFQVLRVDEDTEKLIKFHRSYSFKDHEFHMVFDNPDGKFDLIVEIANSNPISRAKVSVIVVEEP